MTRTFLSAVLVLVGVAALIAPAAFAETVEAVTTPGQGELTMCRNWLAFRSCKPYDRIAIPRQVAVGDELRLMFGSNPKDYLFHVIEIRRKGNGCVLLSDASKGAEDRERLEISRCETMPKPAKPG